ncbi:MAG: Vps5 C terminal like-domain-containing protein [Piptocephalis tieghemiana]|nr:MAG: Vps5 C terminal like-domain-containing protein [Piptocephalis tieghemiana]
MDPLQDLYDSENVEPISTSAIPSSSTSSPVSSPSGAHSASAEDEDASPARIDTFESITVDTPRLTGQPTSDPIPSVEEEQEAKGTDWMTSPAPPSAHGHSQLLSSPNTSPPPDDHPLHHPSPSTITDSFADYNDPANSSYDHVSPPPSSPSPPLASASRSPYAHRSSQLLPSDTNPLYDPEDTPHHSSSPPNPSYPYSQDNNNTLGARTMHHRDTSSDSVTGDGKTPSEVGDRPWFEVHVDEPHKVGVDGFNAHTVYKVTTKTNSPAFRRPTSVVERRYRDFLWLYNRLTNANPGTIVPPSPEKHFIGRFQEDFVEARRSALESCLLRLTTHPLLYGDPDLRTFLEEPGPFSSSSPSASSSSSSSSSDYPPALPSSSSSSSSSNAASSTWSGDRGVYTSDPPRKSWVGAMGDAVASLTGARFHETDQWLKERYTRLEVLEGEMRTLAKSSEGMVKQRKELAMAHQDIATALAACTEDAEDPSAREAALLGQVEERVQELQARFHTTEMTGIEAILDEYVRLIKSAKLAYATRIKLWQSWQSAERELGRKRAALEKTRAQTPSRVSVVSEEVTRWNRRANALRQEFTESTRRLRVELERFEGERIRDLSRSITSYLHAMRELQKEMVNIWSSYLDSTAPSEGNVEN